MENWAEIRNWRKAQRARLIAERMALRGEARARHNAAITGALEKLLTPQMVIGFYWPIRGEYDARKLIAALLDQGARAAMPVVVQKGAPLVFRDWRPGTRMENGFWDIPMPAEGDLVVPTTLLVPLVGFDEMGYRLGYGGGYYDRTLASMPAKPLAIGVGYELAHLETIYPQLHDIPMSAIVTEGRVLRGTGSRAPIC
ncbi:MAG TPA: 5-formyltetrahydrofolate cyclo-ligase [Stellaceae bacterium]|nr:5-formyltetrahydrofolate cyclo-ligase [Stellaceae bacterium]